jgi:hypothetical protein
MTTDTKETAAVYSVWVGSVEINDYYLTYEKARRIAQAWIDDGYKETNIRQEIEVK